MVRSYSFCPKSGLFEIVAIVEYLTSLIFIHCKRLAFVYTSIKVVMVDGFLKTEKFSTRCHSWAKRLSKKKITFQRIEIVPELISNTLLRILLLQIRLLDAVWGVDLQTKCHHHRPHRCPRHQGVPLQQQQQQMLPWFSKTWLAKDNSPQCKDISQVRCKLILAKIQCSAHKKDV